MQMWDMIFFLIVIVCGLCADYIFQIRKVYKITHEKMEEKLLKLYAAKERGERFLSVLGVMYFPIVLGMIEDNSISQNKKVVIFLMVTAIVIALNCRIYKYAICIRKLEIYH